MKFSERLQALIADGEIPLSDTRGKLIDDLKAAERLRVFIDGNISDGDMEVLLRSLENERPTGIIVTKPKASAADWIKCSDRMPDEGGRYWCYVEEINSLGKSHYQWNCSWNGDVWSDAALTGRVTHWMPLAPPPRSDDRSSSDLPSIPS